VKKNPSLINKRDESGYAPIHCASNCGKADTVKVLIAAGADVNLRTSDKTGSTPLHCAASCARECCEEIIALLVKSGARLETRDNMGGTPLAASAVVGDLCGTMCLVKYGANVNAVNPHDRMTPLFYAVMSRKHDTVKFLLENGAASSLNMKNDKGETPLAYAKRRGLSDIAALLESHGGK
jgi:ankyrin repeat protein